MSGTGDATPSPVSPPAIERLRARAGRLELVGEHLARLLEIPLDRARSGPPFTQERELAAHLDHAGRRDGVLELYFAGGESFGFSAFLEPDLDRERLAEGVRVVTAGARPAVPQTKAMATAARAAELLAQARQQEADELIWCGVDGALVGATRMNLFLVRGATLVTPSVASGAWPGILRRAVLIAARQLGTELRITVSEERLLPADLARADDAFLASSAHGIVAIASIDGRPLPAPPRGSPARALVPKLRLRVHELCRERFLPAE
jgi:branched-subunit amino acid aminotransferase/4-amino-4-deoxychorismate lyase